ncbi:MAG: hypothetical protein IJ494_06765 [Bacteroides sp.]|nr:hypothetical protein [Bacteroides sp.]
MISHNITIEYKQWFSDIKQYIRRSQIKAAVKVNSELLKVYWQLGKEISERKAETAWGSGFFNMLSRDLREAFPNMQGFSVTNLKYCKRFYLLYNQSDLIRQQVVDELDSPIFLIPWGHHTEIIAKCKTVEEALFYVNQTIENGWSRALLLNFLDSELYQTQGRAITNFTRPIEEIEAKLKD